MNRESLAELESIYSSLRSMGDPSELAKPEDLKEQDQLRHGALFELTRLVHLLVVDAKRR